MSGQAFSVRVLNRIPRCHLFESLKCELHAHLLLQFSLLQFPATQVPAAAAPKPLRRLDSGCGGSTSDGFLPSACLYSLGDFFPADPPGAGRRGGGLLDQLRAVSLSTVRMSSATRPLSCPAWMSDTVPFSL